MNENQTKKIGVAKILFANENVKNVNSSINEIKYNIFNQEIEKKLI